MTDTVLILRTCDKDGKSHGGFQWPLEVGATCTAPDWSPENECGHGLHGALWGEGDGDLFSWDSDALWMVVETDAASVVDLGGKVKFPSCVIRHVGDRMTATAYLANYRKGAIIGGTSTSGFRGTSTSGDRGTSTSGDCGTSTSGDRGTSTSGYRGTSTSGYGGIVVCRWLDTSAGRYCVTVGYCGENGIKPNTPYRCNEHGALVEAQK